jgi:prepilin-type N-terminal cleavage/methylation domain-containing protein/prepilin-type processing-associated H-X9-DG protein
MRAPAWHLALAFRAKRSRPTGCIVSKLRIGVRGFTLTEILVVIGIIAILSLLSLGVIQNAIGSAKTAKCTHNLQTLGGAFSNYEADHNETFPGNPDPDTPGNAPWWMSQIAPYLNYPVWQTPYVGGEAMKCPGFPGTPQWQTYAINQNLVSNITSVLQVKQPAQTILAFDCIDGGVATTSVNVVWTYHNNKANFLMMDGSVTAFSSTSEVSHDSSPYWNPLK